jgi:alpha-glucosidase (family GH31 glycosyl hydrolase)
VHIRTKAIVSALAALLGLVVAVHPGTASAAPHRHAVRSGDARFEVLSPTLIRMEYAGDGTFTDAATFNAIGRDRFGPVSYTELVVDGWLTITTSQVTLRYKVDSGPFTAQNVSVSLRAGSQTVHPSWPAAATCAAGTLCEAEKTTLAGGVSVAADHTGFTGTGFAAGFQSVGGSLTYQLDVPAAGTYDLRVRYANSVGGDGGNTTRTLSASVDGGAASTLTMPTTADWNTWALATVPLQLTAGRHTLVVSRAAANSGNVNIDSLALTAPGAPYPSPGSTAVPCPYGAVCEAEDGALTGGAAIAVDHSGYSGSGFVAGLEKAGATDTVALRDVPADGSYALQVRYANGGTSARTMSVSVNGGAAASAGLPVTANWDTWSTVTVPVTLAKGSDTVALGCPSADSCHVNLDTVAATPATAPILPAHSPLGGYRRGLDGVSGSAVTTPGLLYRDGWYLLDDTASALFDPAARTVRERPGGRTYQDGYLFGYGQGYEQGLRDLATLTGPSGLLPRWAYGVWYSEYYDYTAADYENTVLPRFRADGVPLDVLVTDTDFKSPSTWDGWEMDGTKFPDPAGFFAWAQSQGLHNTLNIHPSIGSNDPQYPAAQATAQGKLAQSGCSAAAGQTCHVFDWSDPAQLKAYLDLHQTMEKQGADFWWLDWCCDDSRSSASGVTPDAWINQQYAWDTAKNVGRGFAFSRAFGSLQSSGYSGQAGVPTGPWADKRTTVHFTGDTTSNWQTLAFEAGYTPGESAATGLSAVSHDIGGFNGPAKLSDDLYVRWVQLGAFQPILRLHGNHSDRLPWQYGDAARTAAEKFLNLREALVPYTYTLAHEASVTGVPAARATYLEYPDQPGAYDASSREYLYGSDVLVAPVAAPGTTATTSVWFPPGRWTDYFTGRTYTGPTTADVTTDWTTMPVFLRAGGIVPARTGNVANDVQNPLSKVTLTVAGGADGAYSLYEDDGTTAGGPSATTAIHYTESGHTLRVDATQGTYSGQPADRAWTAVFTGATAPATVTVDGTPTTNWKFDANHHTLTVTVPARSLRSATTISYS